MITLYDFWRSSAAYRVRIALNIKGLGYTALPINLGAAAQSDPAYVARNPQGLVPLLVEDSAVLSQSLAIMEYLDETHPQPPLLPASALARAQVRSLAQIIACDIHPLNNLRVLNYLKNPLGQSDDVVATWYRHWIISGFAALENRAQGPEFIYGDTLTLADVCLVPQLANARRFATDLAPYPKLVAIDAHLRTLPAFAAAAPELQPDAPQ